MYFLQEMELNFDGFYNILDFFKSVWYVFKYKLYIIDDFQEVCNFKVNFEFIGIC